MGTKLPGDDHAQAKDPRDRYAALPRNRRTLGSGLREFAQFVIASFSPGFNLDRYDRELRRPFPSQPQFAPESKVWRREHGEAKRIDRRGSDAARLRSQLTIAGIRTKGCNACVARV